MFPAKEKVKIGDFKVKLVIIITVAIDTFVIQLAVLDWKLFPLKGKLLFVTIIISNKK